ncbi:hypothetical protein Tco_0402050, partial [Tanacetum coccineum]
GRQTTYTLEQRENTHLEQVEATQGNNGLSSVTTTKGRVIFPSSVLSPREKGMKRDVNDFLTLKPLRLSLPHCCLSWTYVLDAFDSDCDELNSAKISYHELNLSRNGSNEQYAEIERLKQTLSEQVVKERTTGHSFMTAREGFEHSKALLVKTTSPWSQNFEVKNMNQVLSENERLLAQAIDHDICLELKTELLNKKDVVDKETYDKLVRLSASASGSQPSGNTRNDKILQTPSSNSKNKVEAHSRNVKSSLK